MRVSPLPVFFLSPWEASACRDFADVLMLKHSIFFNRRRKFVDGRWFCNCYDSNQNYILINHLRIRKCFNMFRRGRMYFWFWWLRRQCRLPKYCGLIHMHVQSWIYRKRTNLWWWEELDVYWTLALNVIKKHTVYPASWQYAIVKKQRDGLTIRKASKRLAKWVIYIYRSHQKVSKSR